MNGKRILIADDEKHFLGSLSKRLELLGGIPVTASTGREALEISRSHPFDMAIIDYYMPEIAGIDTIARLRSMNPGMFTVLLTSFGNSEIRKDAEDLHTAYFEKDNMKDFWAFMKSDDDEIMNPDSMYDDAEHHPDASCGIVNSPLVQSSGNDLDSQDPYDLILPNHLFYNRDTHWLIGGTGSMEILKKKIVSAAAIESHVLIIGENGTGKDIVARSIHSLSRRKNNRFAGINCGTGLMTPDTLEKELWGYESGLDGLSGISHMGLFESCRGGSVFLDNIQDMTHKAQRDLWQTLSYHQIMRKGGKIATPADIRIIAACPSDKKSILNEGLFDSLTSIVIRIPPLRERRDDIAPLCSYFMDKFGKEYGKTVRLISDDVLSAFGQYSFPGNIQELASLIERAVLLMDGQVIELSHLPSRFHDNKTVETEDNSPMLSLAEVEKRHIVRVMKALDNNRTKAADVLGISRAALWRKLKDMEKEN